MWNSKGTPTSLRYPHPDRYAEHSLPGTRSGFTLIEIIIVIAILAIAAMTAIPLMSSGGSVQIRSAANMIAADLEYARSMAISRGQYYSVEFFEGAESYQIEDQNNVVISHPVKRGFDYIISFQNDSRLNKVDITNVNFNGTAGVQFDSLGSPYDLNKNDLNSQGIISLNANGPTATITVEPVTGYISISN